MSNNQIESIEEGCYSLTPGAFKGLTNLEYLDLSNNKISELGSVLRDLKNLKVLKLDKNQIRKLTAENFKKNSNLEIITLEFNKISEIEEWTFQNQEHLIDLNLSSNRLVDMGPCSFSYLSNLKDLKLSMNRIKSIHDKTFFNSQRLEKLDLSYNYLKKIDCELFNTPNLQCLNLRSNLIADFNSLSFGMVSNLKTLDMSHNKIININGIHLAYLDSLKELNLSNNSIQDIDDNSFQELTSLINLNLSNNEIKHFNFQYLKESMFIDLDNNSFGSDAIAKLSKDAEIKNIFISLSGNQNFKSNELNKIDTEWSKKLDKMVKNKNSPRFLESFKKSSISVKKSNLKVNDEVDKNVSIDSQDIIDVNEVSAHNNSKEIKSSKAKSANLDHNRPVIIETTMMLIVLNRLRKTFCSCSDKSRYIDRDD